MGKRNPKYLLEDPLPVPDYALGGELFTMGAGLVSTLDGLNGKSSKAGGMLSGAMTGAGALSFLGPYGMAAGALGGGLLSSLMEKKMRQEKERQQAQAREDHKLQMRQTDEMNSQAILSQYPTKGVQSPGFYKLGGSVQPSYQVEDGEVLFADDRMPPATDKFGKATQIAPNTFKFSGVTHNHKSGGIGVSGGNTPYTDMYGDVKPSGFVLSDKLTTNARKYLKNI